MTVLGHSLPEIASTPEQLVPIDRPYLIVLNVPHYVDEQGDIFLDSSWNHDFIRHLTYLPQLVMASPRMPISSATEELVRFEGDPKHFLPLPPQTSTMAALRSLPRVSAQMFRAVNQADIVHVGVAGWPYPLGWLASALATLRGKGLVVIVESAPWRSFGAGPRTLRQRVRTTVYESLASWACRNADLALYTQPSYRDSLHQRGKGNAYVTPATWIRAEDALTDAAARASWQEKSERPVRLLFAGRYLESKGVSVLLEALKRLDQQGLTLEVDFIGAGDLQPAIDDAIQGLRSLKARRLKPVPYNASFFDLVQSYHAVLVPSLGDEQPRILFDAAARAVPVIASATDGIRPYVADGESGRLVTPGDVESLASVISTCAAAPESFARYGLAALVNVRTLTHEAMHITRSQLLARHFPGASSSKSRR